MTTQETKVCKNCNGTAFDIELSPDYEAAQAAGDLHWRAFVCKNCGRVTRHYGARMETGIYESDSSQS